MSMTTEFQTMYGKCLAEKLRVINEFSSPEFVLRETVVRAKRTDSSDTHMEMSVESAINVFRKCAHICGTIRKKLKESKCTHIPKNKEQNFQRSHVG